MSESIEKPRHKRGDVREDGMVFWGYQKESEYWVSEKHFYRLKDIKKQNADRRKAENPEYEKLLRQKSYQRNKEADKARCKQWREKNKDYVAYKNKKWYAENAEESKKSARDWYAKNPDRAKAGSKLRKQRLKESLKNLSENELREYREAQRRYSRDYAKNKRKEDPLFALACRIRCRINEALKRGSLTKKGKSLDLLGCTIREVKAHLEKGFSEGMSWENHGKWHIDHIVPLASAKDEESLLRLFHYTNLQPLWAKDNFSKGAKLPPTALDTKPANK